MKKTIKIAGLLVFALASLATLSVPASAITYNFQCITNNNASNCAIGEAQLTMVVASFSDSLGQGVGFTFYNTAVNPASITDVYFDDGLLGTGVLAQPMRVINNNPIAPPNATPVSFSPLATPANLPGGNPIGFTTTTGFSADSDNPITQRGVNEANESVTIAFAFRGSNTLADVIQALNSGALRVGLHVQSIGATGGSEGFVNIVPEPGFYGLLALGLGGLFLAARRRQTQP